VTGRKRALHELAGSGDDGSTSLLGGGRVPKNDSRVEAYGAVDEASSAIGLARGLSRNDRVGEILTETQRGLYRLGAELATNPSQEGKFGAMSESDVEGLERILAELEALVAMPRGFVLPGATAASGAIDLARATVRRAERRWLNLLQEEQVTNRQAGRYLNRLSLLLFVLARFEENGEGALAPMARE
jgi:cob(I)alamin adenosyltransferase